MIRLILSAAILLILLSSCTNNSKTPQSLQPVSVQLAWIHQSQFAGLYAADQKGFYAEEGLAVTLIPGGPTIDKLSQVLGGTAQFGITSPDELILARADGKPVKAVAIIFRRSPVVFISLAEKGITRPQDFVGKSIRSPSNIVPSLKAMMAKVGVSPDQYTIVDLPSDLDMFASGEVEVWGSFSNGMQITAEQAGYQINKIYPDDYGVHFYSDTLFTSDSIIATQPDLVLSFLRATLKGWTYAVENPGEIPAMELVYAPELDPKIEEVKFNATIPLVNTGEDHFGWMKPEIWDITEETLRKYEVLTKTVDVSEVYTMQFLDEIYK
jgi:NitT/TauT family transport system substrate-binding protein